MPEDLVSQFYSVYNDHRLDLLDDILAPNYVGQVNGRVIAGAEAAKGFISAFLEAFPDAQYIVHDTIASGDKSVARWSATATHAGAFAGIDPTGKQVNMLGITIFEIANGQIQSLWNTWDVFGLVQQLRA